VGSGVETQPKLNHQLYPLHLLSDFLVLIAFVLCVAFMTFTALYALSLALHKLDLLHSLCCTYIALCQLHYVHCVGHFKIYNSLCRPTVS